MKFPLKIYDLIKIFAQRDHFTIVFAAFLSLFKSFSPFNFMNIFLSLLFTYLHILSLFSVRDIFTRFTIAIYLC